MPISPENLERYPEDWKQIRQRILDRSGNKCEWCGVPNYAYGVRDAKGAFRQIDEEDVGTAKYVDGQKVIQIVLTIAHIDHAPENCQDCNLAALCQRCHNRHDVSHRCKTRSDTRIKKDIAAGQLMLVT